MGEDSCVRFCGLNSGQQYDLFAEMIISASPSEKPLAELGIE